MTHPHWCVPARLQLLSEPDDYARQFVIDEVDEDMENLEVALSSEVCPGKRRRRLSLLVVVSTVCTASIAVLKDLMLDVRRKPQELALAIRKAVTSRKASKK